MQEVKLDTNRLFFSRTDRTGKILDANNVFYEISRYSRQELLNKPHNIIRHPDNPKLIFKIMWDSIQKGDPFFLYIKNRTKDKKFYWVGTLVLPLYGKDETISGYLSIRLAPTGRLFHDIQQLYAQILQAEKAGETQKAEDLLRSFYQERGFKTLASFMNALLEEELQDKKDLFVLELSKKDFDNDSFYQFYIHAKVIETQYSLIYEHIGSIVDFTNYLQTRFKKIYETSETLALIALNSSVQSNKLGSQGATFFVVSSAIKKNSEWINNLIIKTEQESTKTIENIEKLRFRLNLTRLLSFATIYFIDEYNKSNDRNNSIHQKSLEDIFLTLFHVSKELEHFLKLYLKNIESLEHEHVAAIQKTLSDLNYIYLNGLIESAKLQNNIFTIIFRQIQELVVNTFSILDVIRPKLANQKKQALSTLSNIEFILEDLSTILDLPIEEEKERG